MRPPLLPSAAAPLAEFLRALWESGEVEVNPFTGHDLDGGGGPELDGVLVECAAAARETLAGEPPALELVAARWATKLLYRACQLLVSRDVPAEVVVQVLGEPCPSPRGPACDYAVDLVFRVLPELGAMAERLAPGDAFTGELRRWAREWPLSSVGLPVAGAVALDSFAGHPVLWRLYLDRIANRRAFDRLVDPRVATQLQADLGAHADLDAALAGALHRQAMPPAAPSPVLTS